MRAGAMDDARRGAFQAGLTVVMSSPFPAERGPRHPARGRYVDKPRR
jgi:hypothetical protein